MAIDLADYERKAREAIQAFWDTPTKSGVFYRINLIFEQIFEL